MTKETVETPKEIRQAMKGDLHRPIYHFLPPRNWMNDPNGLFYWGGRYHLFYQFNPYHPLWGNIHWGHVSSVDLVHWEDHPLALIPEKGSGDENGCWSGCLVDDRGVPTAVYTGFVDPVNTPVLLARSQDPLLIRWHKSQHNPVIGKAPQGVNATDFRDPYVWYGDGKWILVIGAGLQNGDCAVLLYDSPDLIDWQYQGPLYQEKSLDSVTMWECPNFFKLEDKYVLLVSLFPDIQGVYYYVGSFDGRRFMPQIQGYYEPGPIFYAPQVRQFQDGKPILFGWLLEGRSKTAIKSSGWAGVQSLPRELALDDNGYLISKPLDALATLREACVIKKDIGLQPGERERVPVRGRYLEIVAQVSCEAGVFVLAVLASPDGAEVTYIQCDFDAKTFTLDTSRSSQSDQVTGAKQTVNMPEPTSKAIKIHAFIDGSVIEVWIDDRVVLSGRAYPTMAESDGLYLFSKAAHAKLDLLRVWQMAAIWPTDFLRPGIEVNRE